MIKCFLVDSYFMYYLVTKALSKNVNNAWLAPFGTLSHVGAQKKKNSRVTFQVVLTPTASSQGFCL